MTPLKEKIWDVWQQDPIAENPESAVKKRCVPALFRDYLFERNSLAGRATLALRKWCKIDNEDKRWQAIFQKVFSSINQQDVEKFPGSRGYYLYQLSHPEKPPCLLQLEKLFAPSVFGEVSKVFFSVYSLLGEKIEGPVNADILAYPPELLPAESLIPLVQDEPLKAALEERKKTAKIIAAKDAAGLKERANEIGNQIRGLKAGESKLHFANLPGTPAHLTLPKAPDEWSNLQEFLLENKGADSLAREILKKASPQLRKKLKQPEVADVIRLAVKVLEKNDFGWLSQPLNENMPLWKRILLSPAEWIRGQTDKIARQIKDSLLDRVKQRIGQVLSPPLQNELYQLIRSEGDESRLLEERIGAFLAQKLDRAKGMVDKVLPAIAEQLPPAVPLVLDLFGKGTLGHLEQPFWMEWKREANGLFTVSVYITGQAIQNRPLVEGEPQAVLRYTGISEKQLDEEFFNRLLSYELPKKEVSYSFKDVEAGLLSCLGDVSKGPSTKSQNAHLSYGHWGILLEYAQKKNGMKPQESYFFAKRNALIQLWQQPDRAANKRVLEASALDLARFALELSEKGLLSGLELKHTYATTHEVLASLAAVKPKGANTFFPPMLIEPLKNLLGAVGCTTANLYFLKELLNDALGSDAEKNIDVVLKTVQEELGEIKTKPIVALPNEPAKGLTALKTALVGLRILINPMAFVAQMVSLAAKKTFSFLFPGVEPLLNRLKRKLIVKTMALFLPKAQRQQLEDAILALRQMAACDKELSFTCHPAGSWESASLKPLSCTIKPLAPEVQAENGLEFLLEENLPVRPDNVTILLKMWKGQADVMAHHGNLLLNSRLSTLPLPTAAFWKEIKDVEACMEALAEAAMSLAASKESRSLETQHQTVINLYTLYAIMEVLAKRSPDAGLSGSPLANPVGLAHWVDQPNFRLLDLKYVERLKELQAYFFPNARSMGSINDSSLFPERENELIEILHWDIEDRRRGYLSVLLLNKSVQESLEKLNLSDAPEIEKLTALYTNPPVPGKEGKYNRILPQAFASLRIMHQICNGAIRSYDDKIKWPEFKNVYDFCPLNIEQRNHPLRLLLSVFLGGYGGSDKENSIFRQLPLAFTLMKGKIFNVTQRIYTSLSHHHFLEGIAFKNHLSMRDKILKEGNSQVSTINKESDQQTKFEKMILAGGRDEPVRVLSYFEEDPGGLLLPKNLLALEHSLLRENLLRDQLKVNPEFLETAAQFFTHAFQWMEKNGHDSPQLRYLAVLVHLEAETLGRSFLLEEWLESVADKPYYKYLIALKHSLKDPRNCSEGVRKKVVEELLSVCRLSPKGFYEEDFEATFEETMARWKPCMKELLEADLPFRQELLPRLCQRNGFDIGNNIPWGGNWPVYSVGAYSLNLLEKSGRDEANYYREGIRSFIEEHFFDEKIGLSELKNGVCHIPELNLTARIDLAGQRLNFTKTFEGEEFQWVSRTGVEKETRVSYWRSEKGRLLKMKNGQVVKVYQVNENESLSPSSAPLSWLKEETLWNGEWLEKIALPPLLVALGRFQPLHTIQCFTSRQEPGQVKLLQFDSLNLQFEVKKKGGSAESVGKFPGFFIAPAQRLEPLNAYGSYLLLQNSQLEKKVILPTDGIYAALLNGFVKRFQLGEASCFQLLETISCEESGKYFDYSLDEQGRLISSNPAAIAHLFLYHLAKWNVAEMKFYLKILEGMGKREQLPQNLFLGAALLHLAAAVSGDQELLMAALRLTALLNESGALHPVKRERDASINLLSFLVIQDNYSKYLDKRKYIFPPITPFQEMSVIRHIIEERDRFCAEISEDSFILDKVKESILLPKVRKRCQEIAGRYAPKLALDDFWTRLLLEFSDSTVGIPDLNQVAASQGPKLATALFENWNFFEEAKRISCMDLDMGGVIPFDMLPTEYNTVDPSDIHNHFLSYYHLVCQTPPKDPKYRDFHKKKIEQLRRTLTLMKGSYRDKKVGVSIRLLLNLLNSPHRFTFPSAENLRLDLKNRTKMVDSPMMLNVIRQCALDDLALKAAKEGIKYAEGAFDAYIFQSAISDIGIRPFYLWAGTFGWKGWRAWQKANQTTGKEDRRLQSNQLLPPLLSAEYRKLDAKIEQSLAQLVKLTFTESPPTPPKPLEALTTGDPVAEPFFQKINQSADDYAARPLKPGYKLKSGFNLYPLQSHLEKASADIAVMLNQEKAGLLKQLEGVFYAVKPDVKKALLRLFDAPIDFDTLLECFLKDDRQQLKERWNLSEEEIGTLNQKLYRYLILATREQQLSKCLKMVVKLHKMPKNSVRFEQSASLLAEELCRERAYGFDTMPERLVRGHLLFEFKHESLLWKNQVEKICGMLKSGHIRSFVELIMGSGKTYYGIPITDLFSADGGTVPINIWPAAMKRTNINQIAPQADHFSQDAYAFSFSRNEPLTPQILQGRLLALIKAIREGGQINMSKEEAQSLELIWLEYVHKQKNRPEALQEECLDLLTELVGLIRFQGKAVIDEAHEIFRRDQILNHPIGGKKSMPKGDINVIEEFARGLLAVKDFDVRDNQRTWQPSVYWEKARPLLAEKFCRYKLFEIPFEERILFKEFLMQKPGPIPELILKHPKYRELSLARGLINTIAPQALKGIVSVNYGPSQNNKGKFARPYQGNQNPKEQATIQNPYEACLKTFLQQITKPFSEEDAAELIDLMKAQAHKEKEDFGRPISQTAAGKQFAEWCRGYSLENCPIAEAAKRLNEQPEAILRHAAYFIAPTIHFFDRFFSSNSHNFASMFPTFFSGTGTPSNAESFPAGTKPILDEGTVGESIDWLRRNCRDSIVEIASTKPLEAARDILKLFTDKTKAIIDCGALFRGVDNKTIAEMKLPKFPGVAFFDKELVVLDGPSKPKPIGESKISEEERGAFFDDSHTQAANIPLDLEAEGILTVGENITLTRLTQGMWRLRGLKKGKQTIRIVLNSNVRRMISGDSKPSIEQIIKFAAENEARTLSDDAYFADHQKIGNILRRAVLDKMLAAGSSSEMLRLFGAFEAVLLNRLEVNPVLLYGQPVDSSKGPADLLRELKEQCLEEARNSGCFSGKEVEGLEKEYQSLFEEIATRVYPKTNPQLREGLGLEQIETEMSENQTERTETQELNLNQAMIAREENAPDLLESKPWDLTRDYFKNLDWLKKSPALGKHPNFYSLSEVLGGAAIPNLAKLNEAFNGPIWCSENFIGNVGKSLAVPFGPKQKPLLEVLVIQSEKGHSIVLLDQADADQWRTILSREKSPSNIKICLVDLGLNRVVGPGPVTSRDLGPSIQRDLTRLKFLQGSVQYTHKQLEFLKGWIKKFGAFAMHTLYNELHARFGWANKRGTAVEQQFIELEIEEKK